MRHHLVFAAPDLQDGVNEVEARFGVRAGDGGQHLGQGTHNKLLALGPTTYLEIIAPDPTQPEPPGPRPYGVDGVTQSLVGWAIACDDIDRALDEARATGFDPGDVIDGRLESLHVEHPDPEWIVRVLRALGTNVDVYKADRTALVAHLIGPTGGGQLR